MDGLYYRFVTGIKIEEQTGRRTEFVMGEATPTGVSEGSHYWIIEVEEQIPAGSGITREPPDSFSLKLYTDKLSEEFTDCSFHTTCREYTKSGMRRVHKGIALGRKELEDGLSEL